MDAGSNGSGSIQSRVARWHPHFGQVCRYWNSGMVGSTRISVSECLFVVMFCMASDISSSVNARCSALLFMISPHVLFF